MMSAKGNHHELLKTALNDWWSERKPKHLRFTTETTFRLTPSDYLESDFVFYDRATGLNRLRGKNAYLVVELAHSSFGYDTGLIGLIKKRLDLRA
jgi:Uma2 family endonuclease